MKHIVFISGDSVISDIAQICGDSAFREHPTSWYRRRIYDCLRFIGVHAMTNRGMTKILDMPEQLSMVAPDGVYNLEEIYVYSCNHETDCCCDTENPVKLHWKNRFNNQPAGGVNYTAKRRNVNSQSFDGLFPGGEFHNWFNIEDGTWMFSPGCSAYNKIKIKYVGMVSENDKCLPVPVELKDIVVEWACEKFFEIKKNVDNGYTSIWRDYKVEVQDRNPHNKMGVAKGIVKRMSIAERADFDEYWSRANF